MEYVPMLCESIKEEEAEDYNGWAVESKVDGDRIIAYVNGDDVKFVNRRGNEVAFRFFSCADVLRGRGNFVVDGEVAVLDDDGVSDFNRLQFVSHLKDKQKIKDRQKGLIFYVFDILEKDGVDVRGLSYRERRKMMSNIIEPLCSDKVVIIPMGYDFREMWNDEMSREGVILKRVDSLYQGKRSRDWLKVKKFSEAVVEFDGFEEHENKGGITLTNHKKDRVSVCSPEVASKIREMKFPIDVECQFLGLTKDGHMRCPSFKGVNGETDE
jgi:bifunctional non-homologous end joining protein LigD